MTSRVDGGSNPNWIGGEQVGYLDIEDQDHVVFRTPPLSVAGTELVGRLRWQRRRGDAASLSRQTDGCRRRPQLTGTLEGCRCAQRKW